MVDEDFMKAVRKVKQLTTSIPHNTDFVCEGGREQEAGDKAGLQACLKH